MSYRLLQFGAVTLPTARISGTFGTGPTVDASIQVIGGMYDAHGGEEANLRLPYEQTYSAWLVGTYYDTHNELEDLMALRGKRNILYRISEENNDQTWCYARCTQVRTPWQIQRKTMQPVDIVFSIQTPWYGMVHGTGWSLDTGYTLDTGLFFEDVETHITTAKVHTFTLTNFGNVATRLVSVRVTTPYEALSSIRFQVGDCDFTWAGTLAIGKQLEINGRTMTITNDGTDAYSGLTLNAAHVSGWWLELPTSINTVTVTTDINPPVQLEFDFADGWA